MEADVLNALQSQSAYLPGGRDRDERLLMLIPVPNELQPWTKQNLDLSIKFLLSILRYDMGNHFYMPNTSCFLEKYFFLSRIAMKVSVEDSLWLSMAKNVHGVWQDWLYGM